MMAAGGTKMLSFSNSGDRCTQLRQVILCLAMQALVHRDYKLVRDSICHIEPMFLKFSERSRCVKPLSYFFVPLTTRTAAFMTRCNLSVTEIGAPANSKLQ